MWRAFAKFCGEQHLRLQDLSVSDLETYLAVRGAGPDPATPRMTTAGATLSPRYANRYLVLIHNVTSFSAKAQAIEINRAAA